MRQKEKRMREKTESCQNFSSYRLDNIEMKYVFVSQLIHTKTKNLYRIRTSVNNWLTRKISLFSLFSVWRTPSHMRHVKTWMITCRINVRWSVRFSKWIMSQSSNSSPELKNHRFLSLYRSFYSFVYANIRDIS